jgi:hypothetical protein
MAVRHGQLMAEHADPCVLGRGLQSVDTNGVDDASEQQERKVRATTGNSHRMLSQALLH